MLNSTSALAIGSVLAIGAVFFAWHRPGEVENNGGSAVAPTRITETQEWASMQHALAEVRAELGHLQSQYQEQRSATATRAAVAAESAGTDAHDVMLPAASPASADPLPGYVSDLERERREREQAARVATRLEHQLASEGSDSAWAPSTEETIQIAVQQERFTGTRLLTVGCQTTLCRLDLYHDDAGAEDAFVTSFTSVLDFAAIDAFYRRTIQPNGSIYMTLYLSRDGYQLPVAD